MLSWFFPRPPVRPWEKAWTEYRFAWLVETFGADRLRNAEVILPSDDFFPDQYNGSPEDARVVLHRISKYMNVAPARFNFEVLPDDDMPASAGHYERRGPNERPTIRLASSQLADPESVVATLAHEVAHEILLGDQHMTGDEDDHEWVTDLLPAYLGLGIFAANATIRERSGTSGTWHWWNAKRQGYLSSHIHGYALALFIYLREDWDPDWMRELRLDARSAMQSGLRYLRRTGDCWLDPQARQLKIRRSPPELSELLSGGTLSGRILAMWAARDEGRVSLIPEIQRLLRHRHAEVRCAAVRTLAAMDTGDPQYVEKLVGMLRDHDDGVRGAAAEAMEMLQPDSQAAVLDLADLLSHPTSEIVQAAAGALRAYGPRARLAEKQILAALHQALIDCSFELTDLLIDVVRRVAQDPGQSINDYFRERDAEFRQAAIDALYSDQGSGMIYPIQ